MSKNQPQTEQTQTQTEPQVMISAADYHAILQRLDALQVDNVRLQQAQVVQPHVVQVQPAPQPIALNGMTSVLVATMGKNGKPIRATRESLVFGTHPRTADIVEAARHAADVELAYELGICAEPDREGMSPWAVAGIAVGAAALGAGVAVGVGYLLNKEDTAG